MMDRTELKSEAKEFLLDLLHMAGVFVTSACRVPPDVVLDRRAYERLCVAYGKKEARKAAERLKEQKLITMRIRGDRIILELSDSGKLEALKMHIRKKKTKLPAGEWCLVGFDIPEVERKSRLAFRRFLKEIGFEQVQRSLWRTDKDLVVPISELVKRMDAISWIKIYRAREW